MARESGGIDTSYGVIVKDGRQTDKEVSDLAFLSIICLVISFAKFVEGGVGSDDVQ